MCRGVPAFANSCVFSQSSYKARPAQDVAGALYTWLAIAFDGACAPPWLHTARGLSDEDMFSVRQRWIADLAFHDVTVAAVEDVLG